MGQWEVVGRSSRDERTGRRRISSRRELRTALDTQRPPMSDSRPHEGCAQVDRADLRSGSSALFSRPAKEWWYTYRRLVIMLDVLVVGIALVIANVARFSGLQTAVVGLKSLTYPIISLILGVAWIVLLLGSRAYSSHTLGFGDSEYRRVVRATFLLFGGLSMAAVLFQFDFARGFLAIALPLGLLLILMGRWSMRQVLVRKRNRGAMMDEVLLIGSREAVQWTAERINRTPGAGYRIGAVACGADRVPVTLEDGTELVNFGALDDTVDHLVTSGLRTVIIADDVQADRKFLRRLSWQLEDTTVQLVVTSRLTDVTGPRIHWRPVEGLPLMTVDTPRYSGFKYVLKRAFDLSVAVFSAVIVSPLLLVTALAIKAEDNGPVLYRQQRVGINGQSFTMTKFRSMRVDADRVKAQLMDTNEGAGPLFKMRQDPRVTKVGRLIRKLSIDELPQLIDVIRGDMSLVGPRPQLPEEVASLEPHQRRRLKVKPGITGPWQVGGRSNLSGDESVRLDLTYVENWSLSGDLLIMAKTVKAVLARDGAF